MIEFIEQGHIYLCDGVILPSVSDIVKFRFPLQYANIPTSVLLKKASYGTRLHELTERYLTGRLNADEIRNRRIDPNIRFSLEHLNRIKVDVKNVEQIVAYDGRYAGRYDILNTSDELVDIKTTAKLHVDNYTLEAPLNLQLSLYYLALGNYKDHGYCLWMPKGKIPELIEVKTLTKGETLEVLNEYEKVNSSGQALL